jgi:two-component system response regulator HydG
LISEKKFRSDLFYRLSVVSIYLPPLRERRSDVPLLMDHFRKDICARNNKETRGFSKGAQQALMLYDWPGNIRQLRNSVESMIVLDTDGVLDVDDLPDEIAHLGRQTEGGDRVEAATGADGLVGRPLTEVERYYIQRALELCNGKRQDAAALLGIGERTLYRKITEYGLKD